MNFKIDAQNNSSEKVFEFILEEKDTVSVYRKDINIIKEFFIEIIDEKKIAQLKNKSIAEAYFICNCNHENVKLFFHNIFSSSIPKEDFYIYTIGVNIIHFFNDSLIQCSDDLFLKIRECFSKGNKISN